MTINGHGQRLCTLVQCFPILLILAQKHQLCLDTPLVYKPPEPSKPPVSYDIALNTLLHALANRPHDQDGEHHTPNYWYPQGYDNPYYAHGTSHGHGYGVPYYGKDVKDPKVYVVRKGHEVPAIQFYPDGTGPTGYGHNYASGVKVYATPGHYSTGVKVFTTAGQSYAPGVSVYTSSGKGAVGYGQSYAPGTKVYPVHVNKYKVVVRNKRRKSAKLVSESEEWEDACVTIEGGTGACVNIRNCQPYLRILRNAQTNPAAVNILRRSHCGFEGNDPKVCCPGPKPFPTAPPPTPAITPDPAGNSNVHMPDSNAGSSGQDSGSPGQDSSSTEQDSGSPGQDAGSSGQDAGSSGQDGGVDSPYVDALPEPPVCGSSNATSSRVVGGIPAKLGYYPWMALLGYRSRRFPGQPRWLCGGSLVSSKHVLTAAHCIHGREDDLYQVRLGELDLSREDEGATPLDVPVLRRIKHEQYSAKTFTNDIGVLLLAWSVTFTHLIRPICLPRTAELRALTFERYTPIIAGWGDTEFRGPSSPLLQHLQLPVVSNAYCARAYSQYKAQVIDERVLCAGFERGGKDACQGDSGGPLMLPITNPKYLSYFYQIGVVSFGRKCAEAGFPGVYTRITNFMPWLQAQIVGRQSP